MRNRLPALLESGTGATSPEQSPRPRPTGSLPSPCARRERWTWATPRALGFVCRIGAVAVLLGACTPKEGPTAIASPHGEHPAFAEAYPEELQLALDDYARDIARAEAIAIGFEAYPAAFKTPPYPLLEKVYDAAEGDGKSGYYGEVLREQRAGSRYFEKAKPELVKRAGGAVDYEVKKNKCEGEYYGAVSRGLDKGVESDAEKELEQASEAQRIITLEGSSLSKADQDTLRKQASDIALAVYLVNLSLPERHQRLAALEAERSRVESTLKSRKEALEEAPPDAKSSPDAKKAHEAELKLIGETQDKLEGPHTAATQRLESSEKTISATRDRIEDALSKLQKAMKKASKEQPAEPAAKG